eukprot:1157805-Pelagomonas_calceolata.AAC.7
MTQCRGRCPDARVRKIRKRHELRLPGPQQPFDGQHIKQLHSWGLGHAVGLDAQACEAVGVLLEGVRVPGPGVHHIHLALVADAYRHTARGVTEARPKVHLSALQGEVGEV